MKILSYAIALAILAGTAQAASIKEIFEDIAKTAETGNGNGHIVVTLKGAYNEAREIAKLEKEENPTEVSDKSECRYEVYTGISDGIYEIKNSWDNPQAAARLAGMAKKEMIRQIIYSMWDSSTGDSEYCLKSTMKVYGIDGSVLIFDFNNTD